MEDLIKRSDAIDAVICRTTFESEDAIMAMMTIIGEVMNNIANLPSADKSQGEWIKTTPWSYGSGMGEVYGYYQKCSNCGKEFMDKSNFCPNCGADMRERKGE